MTSTEPRQSHAGLAAVALLVLPAVALLLLMPAPIGMTGLNPPWFVHAAAPVAALVGVAAAWAWPHVGWRWVLLAASMCWLGAGIAEPYTSVVLALSSAAGLLTLAGGLGAAAWIGRSGAWALGAAVAGTVLGAYVVASAVRWVELLYIAPGQPLLPVVAGVGILVSAVLVGLSRRAAPEPRPAVPVLIASIVASLVPVAFAVTDQVGLPLIQVGGEGIADWVRARGIVGLVAALAVIGVSAIAGARFVAGVVVVGGLVSASAVLTTFIEFDNTPILGSRPVETVLVYPGVTLSVWLLMTLGLALGVAAALPFRRQVVASVGVAISAVVVYLGITQAVDERLWVRAAVVALVFAVVAGAGAIGAGAATGVVGVMLGLAVPQTALLWQPRFPEPIAVIHRYPFWTPVLSLAAAAVGLAVLAWLYRGRDDAPAVGGDDLDRGDVVGVDQG
ncbi:hypothetical protein [Alloactinosynnema sp. L-07]|uniref:hypothetical protein n=1 Tax=Alloactinosynnema sp. L-07 TaxID=1653480 RepID=UPI00065EF626|nr:hypothetical protein [Alloactinosynnema sp. L-07]CRK56269.1 hypothetical protein [Alloactinosynnema sp. L-07]